MEAKMDDNMDANGAMVTDKVQEKREYPVGEDGWEQVNDQYLDASPYDLEQTILAVKNFYKSMMNYGFVSEEDYETLCSTIKLNKDM